MALDPQTLADGLASIEDYPANETIVIDGWADAWADYFEESTANGVAANTAPAAAITAFKAALVGISGDNTAEEAATMIKNACKAFWTAAIPTLAYTTTPSAAPGPYLTPPLFMLTPQAELDLVADIQEAFEDNASGFVAKEAALLAVAEAIDGEVQAGATFLDTTVPTPILYTVA